MQYEFGSGNLFGATGATVDKFGALQDVSIDISSSLKSLYGQNAYPLTVARGQAKISGKAKFANLNGAMLNNLFFGGSIAAGRTEYVNQEVGTIPGTPFQITVANGATFKEDLGVTYAATGIPLVRVPSAPATGQYSVTVATGIYLFATADTGLSVYIDYGYTVAASGKTLTVINTLTGVAPSFIASMPIKYNGKTMYLRLLACVSSKLTLATKIEDFLVPEFDFEAFADASGNVLTLSLTE
jgi:hypothetical protein